MSVLNKLKNSQDDTKERSMAAKKEIDVILQKYNCVLDVRQSIDVIPLVLADPRMMPPQPPMAPQGPEEGTNEAKPTKA